MCGVIQSAIVCVCVGEVISRACKWSVVGGKVLASTGCRVGGRQAEAGLPWLLLLCGWLPAARLSSLFMTLSLG